MLKQVIEPGLPASELSEVMTTTFSPIHNTDTYHGNTWHHDSKDGIYIFLIRYSAALYRNTYFWAILCGSQISSCLPLIYYYCTLRADSYSKQSVLFGPQTHPSPVKLLMFV